MPVRSLHGHLLALAIGLSAVVAHAAPSTGAPPQDGAAASAEASSDRFFALGREAMRDGDYAGACRWFEQSDRLSPAPGVTLNRGVCEEALSHLVVAASQFERFLASVPDTDERAAFARAHLDDIRRRAPRIVVRPSGTTSDDRIELDGRALTAAELEAPILVDPGRHEIALVSRGREVARESVIVAMSQTVERTIGRAAPPPGSGRATTTPGSASSAPPRTGPPVLAHVVTAVGAASLVASLVCAVLILQDKATVAAQCDGDVCTPRGLEAAHRGSALDLAGTITFAAGIAGLGGGTVLYLTHGSTAPESAPRTSYGFDVSGSF